LQEKHRFLDDSNIFLSAEWQKQYTGAHLIRLPYHGNRIMTNTQIAYQTEIMHNFVAFNALLQRESYPFVLKLCIISA
jgi:hypothetical protein